MNKKERLNKAVEYLKYNGIVKTQEDIAAKMKAGRPSVSSALSGKESALTDNFIRRFCNVFTEISYFWLLRGEGDMLSNGETKGINWKDAFKDEGFLNELRKFCKQYAEVKTGFSEEDDVAISQEIKLSLLLSLMLANGLKIDKTNSFMFHGNTKKTAQIMHIITGIKLQTCQDFLTDPCIDSKTPDDDITILNNYFIKIGLKIRLKKGIIDVTT